MNTITVDLIVDTLKSSIICWGLNLIPEQFNLSKNPRSCAQTRGTAYLTAHCLYNINNWLEIQIFLISSTDSAMQIKSQSNYNCQKFPGGLRPQTPAQLKFPI